MHLVDKPHLFPGMCLISKSAQGPVIDLGRDFDLDHQGRMYVGARHVKEMGKLCGLVPEEDLEARDELLREKDKLIEDLKTELERATTALEATVTLKNYSEERDADQVAA